MTAVELIAVMTLIPGKQSEGIGKLLRMRRIGRSEKGVGKRRLK
ncbi:hypothetical protein PJI16_17935 [Nitrospira sp. MA-1]|nr:hypothetical protein [Nitrospira sp. MA-1]